MFAVLMLASSKYEGPGLEAILMLAKYRTRVEIFEGGKFRAIPDFALFRKFRGY